MIYSKTCEYAIRALVHMAHEPKARPVTISEMTRKTGVPKAYLAKIVQCLVDGGILRSKSGPGGGFQFAIDPSKLTLHRVMALLDDVSGSALSQCVMGQARCNDSEPCCLHEVWASARQQMNDILMSQTIASMAAPDKRTYLQHRKRAQLSKRMHDVFSFTRKPKKGARA